MRFFVLFVVAAFGAMLVLAGLWGVLGVARAPLSGGASYAVMDVLAYSAVTLAIWWFLSRRLRR